MLASDLEAAGDPGPDLREEGGGSAVWDCDFFVDGLDF